ncbi:MAG: hypothetical protein E6I45_03755, partial [Chloroflexi bacterium]
MTITALAAVLATPATAIPAAAGRTATASRSASSDTSAPAVAAGGETTSVPARFTPIRDVSSSTQAPTANNPGDAAGLAPGIQYEEAEAHAGDHIRFTPGGRVGVPFRPRLDDSWPVDGKAPRSLPAGRRSGLEIARSPTGETDPVAPRNADVDQSSANPLPADTASLSTTSPLAGEGMAASSALRRQVFGFLPYWNVNDSGMVLNYNVLST